MGNVYKRMIHNVSHNSPITLNRWFSSASDRYTIYLLGRVSAPLERYYLSLPRVAVLYTYQRMPWHQTSEPKHRSGLASRFYGKFSPPNIFTSWIFMGLGVNHVGNIFHASRALEMSRDGDYASRSPEGDGYRLAKVVRTPPGGFHSGASTKDRRDDPRIYRKTRLRTVTQFRRKPAACTPRGPGFTAVQIAGNKWWFCSLLWLVPVVA